MLLGTLSCSTEGNEMSGVLYWSWVSIGVGVVWDPYGPLTIHPIDHSYDAPRWYRRCLEAVYGVCKCSEVLECLRRCI